MAAVQHPQRPSPEGCPFHHLPFVATVRWSDGERIYAAEACRRWHENREVKS